jgi:hypothetical protein
MARSYERVFRKLDWRRGQVERVRGRGDFAAPVGTQFLSFPWSVDTGDEIVSRTGQFQLHRVGSRGSSGL